MTESLHRTPTQTRRFEAVRAVDHVDFTVTPGTICILPRVESGCKCTVKSSGHTTVIAPRGKRRAHRRQYQQGLCIGWLCMSLLPLSGAARALVSVEDLVTHDLPHLGGDSFAGLAKQLPRRGTEEVAR
jgi:hypothetical protein